MDEGPEEHFPPQFVSPLNNQELLPNMNLLLHTKISASPYVAINWSVPLIQLSLSGENNKYQSSQVPRRLQDPVVLQRAQVLRQRGERHPRPRRPGLHRLLHLRRHQRGRGEHHLSLGRPRRQRGKLVRMIQTSFPLMISQNKPISEREPGKSSNHSPPWSSRARTRWL